MARNALICKNCFLRKKLKRQSLQIISFQQSVLCCKTSCLQRETYKKPEIQSILPRRSWAQISIWIVIVLEIRFFILLEAIFSFRVVDELEKNVETIEDLSPSFLIQKNVSKLLKKKKWKNEKNVGRSFSLKRVKNCQLKSNSRMWNALQSKQIFLLVSLF